MGGAHADSAAQSVSDARVDRIGPRCLVDDILVLPGGGINAHNFVVADHLQLDRLLCRARCRSGSGRLDLGLASFGLERTRPTEDEPESEARGDDRQKRGRPDHGHAHAS